MPLASNTRIMACRVFTPELTALGVPDDQVVWLDQGLHLYPDKLKSELKAGLERLELDPTVQRVILVYGFCGGGLDGLRSQRVDLVIPLVHDCIPLLMGLDAPAAPSARTYYFSAGWIDYGRTPWTEYQHTAERYGEETAKRIGDQILKSYEDFALIENGVSREERYWQYTCRCGELHDKPCLKVPGTLEILEALVRGRSHPRIRVFQPGRTVGLGDFTLTTQDQAGVQP